MHWGACDMPSHMHAHQTHDCPAGCPPTSSWAPAAAVLRDPLPATRFCAARLARTIHGNVPAGHTCCGAGNGRSKPVCVKNMAPKEIMEHVGWLRNSHGRGQEYQVVRSRHLSRAGSIQGQWGVDTFASQLEATNRRRLAAAQRQIRF